LEESLGEGLLDERQLQRLHDVAKNLVSELELEAVLRQVLETARDLTGARYAALGILDQPQRNLERFLVVGIDEATKKRIGPLPRGRGVLGELIREPEPLRLADVGEHPRSFGFPSGHPPMRSFLGVPILIRGRAFGNLYLTDKHGGGEFDELDEEFAVLLSQWAAVAIENARLIEAEKLRLSINSAEAERRRWARELHDGTLQELGALKVLLEASSNRMSDSEAAPVLERAVVHAEQAIQSLQETIIDLRPAGLDDLGLYAGLESLVRRTATRFGLNLSAELDLGHEQRRRDTRLDPELETAIYRLVQEALQNVVKHSGAHEVEVKVIEHDGQIDVAVKDDGHGFDLADTDDDGFGLTGMRERVALFGGTLELTSMPGEGTTVEAHVPTSRPEESG
jgi:signal transduction histidine kinase